MTHGSSQDMTITRPSEVRSDALFGWHCVLLHDYPEPEGVVWFTEKPSVGQRFMLPSSGYKDEWEVKSVRDDDMSFTAIQPNH